MAARMSRFPSRLWRRAGLAAAVALAATQLLTACGTPNACLANRYDSYVPQYRCVSGLQLPHNILKDTDPMSGSTAPVEPPS